MLALEHTEVAQHGEGGSDEGELGGVAALGACAVVHGTAVAAGQLQVHVRSLLVQRELDRGTARSDHDRVTVLTLPTDQGDGCPQATVAVTHIHRGASLQLIHNMLLRLPTKSQSTQTERNCLSAQLSKRAGSR